MEDSSAKFLSDNAATLSILVVLLPIVLMLPTIVSVMRGLPDRRKIALVNVAGTLFLTPWIAAMAWAVLGKANESVYEKILGYKRWIIGVAAIGLVGLIGLLWFGWTKIDEYRNYDLSQRYEFQPVEAPPGSRSILASGKVVPRSLVQVSSEVSGRIGTVFVDVNDPVVVGQPLLSIEAPNITSLVKQTDAELAVTRAGVKQARAQVAIAEAQLGQQRAVYDRRRQLFEREFLSRADFEAAEAELRSKEEAVVAAEAQLAEAIGRTSGARARSTEARDEAARMLVVAPVSGMVLSRSAEPGQTVISSFQAEELFQIAEDLAAMRLELIVDETEIAQLREGQRATFSVDALPDQTFPGTLSVIEKAPVEQDGLVGYRVFVDIENTRGQFFSGMTALAEFAPRVSDRILWVPAAALDFAPSESARADESGPCVYAERSGELKRVPVEIVNRSSKMVVVSSRSLSVGDRVAVGLVDDIAD